MGDKYYAECRLVGTEADYIYVEFYRKKCYSYGKNAWDIGKDLITGTRVVVDYDYHNIKQAAFFDPFRAGNLHLYVGICEFLDKKEVAEKLEKMSKEDIEKYVKSIKDVKTKYKEAKKEIREENKKAVMEYRQENRNLRSAKRKVKMMRNM